VSCEKRGENKTQKNNEENGESIDESNGKGLKEKLEGTQPHDGLFFETPQGSVAR
jgi:hypothetical protein